MNDHDPKPAPTENAADLGTAPQSLSNPDDLNDLIAPVHGGTDDEDPLAAMRSDPKYADFITDLEYIAAQARLLFAPDQETPSDELWNKIQSRLPEKPEE